MSEILLSQLAYVELISPRPEETVRWMADVFGLQETARESQSVYLRGWAEWLHSSLIVTEGPEPAVRRIGWRTYGPGDPEIIAARLEGSEEAVGWVEPLLGRGPTFRYRAPFGGQQHEVFWEVDRYLAPPEQRDSGVVNRPQRYAARGAGVRYLDHVTVPSPNIEGDIAFYRRLGARHTARTEAEPGFTVFSTLTCNGVRSTHDLGLVPDFTGVTGRAHHIAFRVDQRLDVERAAEVCLAHGTAIECGPAVHGIDEITYLYVREPGGFRMEVNAGGWVNSLPDWQAGSFAVAGGNAANNIYRNTVPPESFTEAWPPLDEAAAAQQREGLAETHLQDQPSYQS